MEIQRTLQQWSLGGTRVKWGAVFAGLVVGIATQMMLTLLGLAIGAWSINLEEQNQGVPIGTGIWTAISMLISAFVGGYVAARMAGAYLRSDGMYHGAVVWGVNWLVFAWLATTAMSVMIGGLFSAFGSALQTLGQGVTQGVTAVASKVAGNTNVNLSMDEVRRQIESTLRATGKPELQPGEIKKDAGNVAGKAQGGQPLSRVSDSALTELREKLMALDREAAINVMINKLGMSEAQAREVVQSTIGMIEPIKQTVQNVKEQSVDVANATLDKIGSAALWMFILALLSLGMSVGGGAVGIAEDAMVEVEGQEYRSDVRRTAG